MRVYENGRYKVLAVIKGFIVLGPKGERIYETCSPEDIEDAVSLVDELAQRDGCYAAVA